MSDFNWDSITACVRCGEITSDRENYIRLADGTYCCEPCTTIPDFAAIFTSMGYTVSFKKTAGVTVTGGSGPKSCGATVTEPSAPMKKTDCLCFYDSGEIRAGKVVLLARRHKFSLFTGKWTLLQNVEVLQSGKAKLINKVSGWGYSSHVTSTYKTFLLIKTASGEELKGMVVMAAKTDEEGYVMEPKGLGLWVGDKIDIVLKPGKVKAGQDAWFDSNSDYVRKVSTNQAARDDWKAKKAAEEAFKIEADKVARAAEIAAQEAAKKAAEAQAEKDWLDFLLTLGDDAQFASSLRNKLTPDLLLGLLRWTYWFRTPVGIGGHRCIHALENYDGKACGCQYPGTGMRAPDAVLYNNKHREDLLAFLVSTGLAVNVCPSDSESAHRYVITSKGASMLRQLDVCPDCGNLPRAYVITNVYIRMYGNGASFPQESLSFAYICDCKRQEYKSAGFVSHHGGNGENCSSTYTPVKSGAIHKDTIPAPARETIPRVHGCATEGCNARAIAQSVDGLWHCAACHDKVAGTYRSIHIRLESDIGERFDG